MRDGELNGDHVHISAVLWMGRIMVHHLEPGIYIKKNLLHLSKRLIIMSSLIQKKSGTGFFWVGSSDRILARVGSVWRFLVRPCYDCRGRGRHRCHHCHGSGRVDGRDSQGNHESQTCHQCHGNGHRRCHVCDGTGKDFKQCQFYTIKTKYYNL